MFSTFKTCTITPSFWYLSVKTALDLSPEVFIQCKSGELELCKCNTLKEAIILHNKSCLQFF